MQRVLRLIVVMLISFQFSGCMIGVSNNTFSSTTSIKNEHPELKTKADVVARFGPPVRMEKLKDNQEHYVYSGSLAWRGFMGIVVVPIPLLVPVGFNDQIYLFEGDKLKYVTTQEMGSNFYGCMFPPILAADVCGAPLH